MYEMDEIVVCKLCFAVFSEALKAPKRASENYFHFEYTAVAFWAEDVPSAIGYTLQAGQDTDGWRQEERLALSWPLCIRLLVR